MAVEDQDDDGMCSLRCNWIVEMKQDDRPLGYARERVGLGECNLAQKL